MLWEFERHKKLKRMAEKMSKTGSNAWRKPKEAATIKRYWGGSFWEETWEWTRQ